MISFGLNCCVFRVAPLVVPGRDASPLGLALELRTSGAGGRGVAPWNFAPRGRRGRRGGGAAEEGAGATRRGWATERGYTLHYVLQGEGQVDIGWGSNRRSVALRAGDSVLVAPGRDSRAAFRAARARPGEEDQGLATLVLYMPAIEPQRYLDSALAGTMAEAREACEGWARAAEGGAGTRALGAEAVEAILQLAQRHIPEDKRRVEGLPPPREGGAGGDASGAGAGAGVVGSGETRVKTVEDVLTYRLPDQSNRLALVFDPLGDSLPFTFGVEIFEPGHVTPLHSHEGAYELFFILNGEGIGRCNGASFPLSAGDVAIFPPGSVHGIDNLDGRLYCLEFMVPNERFAEMVRSGTEDSLDEDDLCALVARGCGGVE